jgi:hypothetical protein
MSEEKKEEMGVIVGGIVVRKGLQPWNLKLQKDDVHFSIWNA